MLLTNYLYTSMTLPLLSPFSVITLITVINILIVFIVVKTLIVFIVFNLLFFSMVDNLDLFDLLSHFLLNLFVIFHITHSSININQSFFFIKIKTIQCLQIKYTLFLKLFIHLNLIQLLSLYSLYLFIIY